MLDILYNIIIYPLIQIIEVVYLVVWKLFRNSGYALTSKCKAFILPSFSPVTEWSKSPGTNTSYYEGFGIPPLEALSVGAKIIVSKAACLPEIYGNTAHYIDPNNLDINLNQLLEQPVESPERILEKYTYDNDAEQLIACLDF